MNVNTPLTTTLDKKDYNRCLEFVLNLYYLWGAPRVDFRRSGQERDIGKYINDHIGGKLAEVAVQKIMASEGLDVKIGFEQYTKIKELHQGDIEGVKRNKQVSYEAPKLKIQIKETKPKNRWLTVPWTEWTGARQDVYIFVRIDFPLDHLIRNFKPHLTCANPELLKKIPDSLDMEAAIEAVYYQDELEKIGGQMEASADCFFDADELFVQSKRGIDAAVRKDDDLSTLRLNISSKPFTINVPARYYEKKNPKSTSKYLVIKDRTVIAHPVLGLYKLYPGIYQIKDKPVTYLREDNLGIHCRNVSFRQDQWEKLINEL